MSPQVSVATAAVREAIDVLSRASADWRNGDVHQAGPVHWSAAVPAAWDALRRALRELEALETQGTAFEDAQDGIAWWNSLQAAERREWLEIAGSAVPADAWRAFQAASPHP